jgi:hypothetical protein
MDNFWKMTLQCRRGKSPLAMESISDRYCRAAARRDAIARNATIRMAREADVFVLQRLLSCVQSLESAINAVAACTTGAAKFAQ